MLDVGFSELLVFGIIALLVLGPEKLPEAARFAAKCYSKFKRIISNVQNDIDRELRLSELREEMNNEMKKIQELEQKMQAQMQQLQQQSAFVADSATVDSAAASAQPTPASSQSLDLRLYTLHHIHSNPMIQLPYQPQSWLKLQDCLRLTPISTPDHTVRSLYKVAV